MLNPIFEWIYWFAVIAPIAYVINFIVNCIRRKRLVFSNGVIVETAKQNYIKELLWTAFVIIAGVAARIVSNGTEDNEVNSIMLIIGILVIGVVGFFVIKLLKSHCSNILKAIFECVYKIVRESLWVFWLVAYSATFTANFVYVEGYDPLALSDCFSFTFIKPILLVTIKIALITVKYKNRLKPI